MENRKRNNNSRVSGNSNKTSRSRTERGRFDSDRSERSPRTERGRFDSDRSERSPRTERGRFDSDRSERSPRTERGRFDSDRSERSPRTERGRFDSDRNNRNRTERIKSNYDNRYGEDSEFIKTELVYGKNAVVETLKGNSPVNKIWISETARNVNEVIDYARLKNVPFKTVDKAKINSLVGEDVNSQGVVAEIAKKEYIELEDLLDICKDKEAFFIVLDGVEDPHNLGAIIRTADAAGVDGIIIPKHGAVGATSAVFKVSAGALERMNICRVTNLTQAVETLKKNNIWIAGVDMFGKEVYSESALRGPIALVLGGEGRGLSLKLKEHCDFTIKIPMTSKANSLNVSVSTAIVMYEVYKQRGFKG